MPRSPDCDAERAPNRPLLCWVPSFPNPILDAVVEVAGGQRSGSNQSFDPYATGG